MKISGGRFQGTALSVPKGRDLTRPTSDKVRQAYFNILRGKVEEGDFLDLYAGSGSVGLEAVSRGFRKIVLVENHPAAFRCLEANCRLVQERGAEPGSIEWKRAEAMDYCKRTARDAVTFSAIFADPPFGDDCTGLWDRIRPLLAEGGVGTIQFPTRKPPDFAETASRVYVYGESSLAVFLV